MKCPLYLQQGLAEVAVVDAALVVIVVIDFAVEAVAAKKEVELIPDGTVPVEVPSVVKILIEVDEIPSIKTFFYFSLKAMIPFIYRCRIFLN